jgi:hypothetical protein
MFQIFLLIHLNLNDIAVGIWSGSNMISSRTISILKTWVITFPNVNLYLDEITNQAFSILSEQHLIPQLKIIEITNCYDYLIGSKNNSK